LLVAGYWWLAGWRIWGSFVFERVFLRVPGREGGAIHLGRE
jgi:hypothetical protein